MRDRIPLASSLGLIVDTVQFDVNLSRKNGRHFRLEPVRQEAQGCLTIGPDKLK